MNIPNYERPAFPENQEGDLYLGLSKLEYAAIEIATALVVAGYKGRQKLGAKSVSLAFNVLLECE